MKKIRTLIFLFSICAFSPLQSVSAAPSKGAELASSQGSTNFRVGLVDVQSAILQTDQGKAARAKIESDMSKKRQELLDQQNQLKKIQNDFQAEQSLLSESDKIAKQKDFQTKLQNFHQAQMTFDQEARQKEAAALQTIFQNMQTVIKKIATQRGFDLVFDKSAGVLLYTPQAADITTDVVAAYNKDFK